MDVVCGRCRAEYEFDDALISERGTTVRCTNCGLQFKVFPPTGMRAPEVWRLFDPQVPDRPCAEYASLGRLQKAIARGEVSPGHLLSRGSEPPRPLSAIAELEPLLKQPRSEPPPEKKLSQPPPPVAASQDADLSSASELEQGPASDAASPALDAPFETDEAIVPASSPPSDSDPLGPGTGSSRALPESKPKIRSALSVKSALTASPATGEEDQTASIAPRTPLRSALQSSQAHGPPPSSDSQGRRDSSSMRESNRPSSDPSSDSQGRRDSSSMRESSRPSSDPSENEQDKQDEQGTTVAEPPGSTPGKVQTAETQYDSEESENGDAPPSSVTRSVPPSSGRRKAHPPHQEKQPDAPLPYGEDEPAQAGRRQRAPTPPGIRSEPSAGASRESAPSQGPASRGARSTWIILAVVAGSVAFVALTNWEKAEPLQSETFPREPVDQGAAKEATERVVKADLAFLEARIEGQEPPPVPAAVVANMEQAGAGQSWKMVDALRLSGETARARRLAQSLNLEEGSYSLAMLDLVEGDDDPPWPVIINRLEEAATGEKAPYLGRAALIYALASSSDMTRAQADFDSWSRLPGVEDSPLFAPLSSLMEKAQEVQHDESDTQEGASTEGSEGESPQTTEDLPAPPASEAPKGELDEADEVEDVAQAPAPKPPPTTRPVERPTPAPAPAPRPAVPDTIKAKVAQADSLWRGGNRDAALRLYREVVSEIGTSHFLGVRANSRIRQAEREKAAAQ